MLKVDIDAQIPLPESLHQQQLADWSQLAYVGAGQFAGGSTQLEVAIAVVDENLIRRVNKTYRNMDKSTNVLAFPAEMEAVDGIVHLGDIVMCGPVIERETVAQLKTPAAHWAHMTIHGMLHLLGYDHKQSDDAKKMESLEIALLLQINFPNPYESQPAR